MVSRKLRVPALFLAASVALLGAGCANGNGANGNGANDSGSASTSGVVTLAKVGNTLKAFTIALEAGQEIADTNRAVVEAAFVSLKPGEGHVDQRTAALMALSNYPLGVDRARLQRVADVMVEFGLLKQHFNIGRLLN